MSGRRLAALAALAVTVVALVLPGPAAHGAAGGGGARVDVMVVGKSRMLAGAGRVSARTATVRAAGRRCAVSASTPLAALAARARARGLSYALRDFGSCSRRAADAAGLFVRRVGRDANRGRDGWVYKVGHRSGTAAAADPGGPFGSGRLRGGQRVTWFWCRMGASGSCQRTLEITSPRRAARGGRITVRVRGYDDRGRGALVGGATVTLAGRRAVTDARGLATLTAPSRRGGAIVRATRGGLVPAFPERIAIG